MRETKQQVIGERGFTYHVTQFGAKQGGRTLVRLLKMVGGAAGAAISGDGSAFSAEAIGRLISNLAETVSEDDFDYLCDTFMKGTQVEGGAFKGPVPLASEGIFDMQFAGQFKELGLWLMFAIEVNYGSFLPSGVIENLKAKATERQHPASEASKPAA